MSRRLEKIGEIYQVFDAAGLPLYTYVPREDAKYEKQLKRALVKGGFCFVTGRSKTGKTCLCSKAIEDMNLICVKVRCDDELTVEELWRNCLEEIKYERAKTKSTKKVRDTSIEGSVSGKFGVTGHRQKACYSFRN